MYRLIVIVSLCLTPYTYSMDDKKCVRQRLTKLQDNDPLGYWLILQKILHPDLKRMREHYKNIAPFFNQDGSINPIVKSIICENIKTKSDLVNAVFKSYLKIRK